MVAIPQKRTNEAQTLAPKHTTRQSSTSRRKRNTRANAPETSGESAEQPSANEEVSQKAGRARASEGEGTETEMVSGELEVGDLIAYSNALDKPMRIIEILGDRFRIERLHDEAKFYVYRSLVVRCTEIVAAELATVSTPEPELKSEAENFNSATPIETGDCVRGKTATGKEITGFALSVGRTCLKLTSGEFIAMDSVAVLARLPENLEQYCELPGKSRTVKLNELLGEYQFYNLSNWDTTPERSQSFNHYNGWEIGVYRAIEVDISKDDETWYTELKHHPELEGNAKKIYDYCVEAIDHAEGIIARLEEYERQATTQPNNAPDNNQLAIIETNPESITSGSTLESLITEANNLYGKLEEAEQVAVSAAHSALEFAREMGDRLLQLKKLAGHGNWEKVREQIKSPRTSRPIPSSTAALYQRIFERWNELDAEAVSTIREASEALKKPRLNSATVADLQPITYEKDLVGSLEGLQADFQERKALAEARSAEEVEQKYERVEDIALPKFNELVALYEAIGDVRLTRDGKGFAVLRPDLGNPFPLSFRNREAAWDYWQRNKDKLLLLAERKPKLVDYQSSSISGW